MVFLNNCGDSLFRSFLQYYYLDSYKEFDFFGVLTFSRATAASGFSSVVMYSWQVFTLTRSIAPHNSQFLCIHILHRFLSGSKTDEQVLTILFASAVCMSLASQWISKRVGRRVMSSFAQLFFLTGKSYDAFMNDGRCVTGNLFLSLVQRLLCSC